MAATDDLVTVEVVHATPAAQRVYRCAVPAGSSVRQAVAVSGVLRDHPELAHTEGPVGIHGVRVTYGAVVAEGDRIEFYRPLTADPKEARRRRALKRERNRQGG